MSKLLLCLLALSSVVLSACTSGFTSETSIPEPTGYVVDNSGVIGDEVESKLRTSLQDFDQKAQIAVVTVPTTGKLDEAQYAIKLAEKWKVGHEDEDNGIIFLIVTDDRKLRIEVGYGLEDKITDAEAGSILDNSVIPSLKKGDWEEGIKNGVEAIMKEIE